jgi:hypothetical protein
MAPVIPRLILTAFILAHALIHVAFLGPRPPATAGGPPWPFDLGHSWILDPLGVRSEQARLVGTALVAITLGGFALASVAALGLGPQGLWLAAAAVGSVGSLALLIAYFHPWLLLGVAIDLGLIWSVLILGWTPQGL